MPKVVWTPADIEKLRAGVMRGDTAPTIARAIGRGFTRSAVLGKANRLGLRLSDHAQRDRHADKRLRNAPPKPTVSPRVRPQTPIPKKAEPLPAPRAGDVARKKIHELESGDCKWPVGELKDPGFGYCGLPCKEGSVYCPDHSARAFSPQKTRARDAKR